MRFREIAVVGTLLLILLPAGSWAKTSSSQAYDQVRGPFETEEEAEAACMEAVGLDENSIRLSTGNVGHLWQVENPLRFLVRRCLNNVKKHEKNLAKAERLLGRTQERIDEKLSKRSKEQIELNRKGVQRSTKQNLRTRADQQKTTQQERKDAFANLRSVRRVTTRAQDRDIRGKLTRKKNIQKEAEVFCRNQQGTQHVMCVRREVREREKALENE